MEQTIKCCEFFGIIRHNFEWFSYVNNKGDKVYCMPNLKADGGNRIRINYCPSCGKEIRSIELIDKKSNK